MRTKLAAVMAAAMSLPAAAEAQTTTAIIPVQQPQTDTQDRYPVVVELPSPDQGVLVNQGRRVFAPVMESREADIGVYVGKNGEATPVYRLPIERQPGSVGIGIVVPLDGPEEP